MKASVVIAFTPPEGLARAVGENSGRTGRIGNSAGQPNLGAGVFQPRAPRPRLRLGLARLEPGQDGRGRPPYSPGENAGLARRAFFLVELLVGILILSLALIPMYQMFVTSSRTMFYSKLSYMAMHAAREELEELRQLPFAKILGGEVAHDWTPVAGRMLARTLRYRPGGASASAGASTSASLSTSDSSAATASVPFSDATSASPFDRDEFDYPKEYQRIETKLELDEVDPPNPRMRRALLMVRWQETGESPVKAGDVGQRAALSRFETILVSHDADLQP